MSWWSTAANVAGNLAEAGLNAFQAGKARSEQSRLLDRQIHAQQMFAQHGIRWRVDDAKAAGIHPLYAVGANVPTYTPVGTSAVQADFSGVGRAGQAVARGVQAFEDRKLRKEALKAETSLNTRLRAAQIKNLEMRNALIGAQTKKLQASVGGSGGIPGQSAKVEKVPTQEDYAQAGKPSVQAGKSQPAFSFVRTGKNKWMLLPSEKAKQRAEEMGLAAWQLYFSMLRAGHTKGMRPPQKAPPGYEWSYSTLTNEFTLKKAKTVGGGSGW